MTKRYISELLNYLDEVSYKFITIKDFEKIQYDRMNSKYKPFIDFCKLIINHSTINLNTSTINSFYFLFDMNRLFEAFLSLFIKQNIYSLKVNNKFPIEKVGIQHNIGKIFNLFSMICDLTVDYFNEVDLERILLDFKYKILSSEKKNLDLSQADFYQMFAYSQSPEQKSNVIILLFPKSELEKINFKKKYTQKSTSTEEVVIYIKSIDLQNIFINQEKTVREQALIDTLNETLNLS